MANTCKYRLAIINNIFTTFFFYYYFGVHFSYCVKLIIGSAWLACLCKHLT